MEFTKSECELLISIFNAGIENAMRSGIPIGKEYYKDIDSIKEKLYRERYIATLNEQKGGSK